MILRSLLTLAASSILEPGDFGLALADEPAKQIRVGIIGLDTSHVTAFTNAVNGPKATPELQVMRIVAAFPGGSPDLPTSIERVPGFTEKVKGFGVEIVDSIDALLPKVDAVLLESVDGRPHLEQARPVIKAGKPLFIDKPARRPAWPTRWRSTGWRKRPACRAFRSSSLRFSPGIAAMKNDPAIGEVLGCVAYSPCSLDSHHPDLFWYGIHGVEELYTIMGPGCVSVSRVHTADTDVVDGRLARRPRRHVPRAARRQGRLRSGGVRQQEHRPQRLVRRLRAAVGGDRQVLPDRQAPRLGRRDAWRFWPSWKPPTKASARTAPGDDRERDGEGQSRECGEDGEVNAQPV